MKTKQYQGIDYQFRPSSYSEPQDPLETILLNVKGTNRRKMIRDYWKAGKLEELDEKHLLDSLDEEQRRKLGRIHPSFMGGEYLPDLEASGNEIARIELESTTSDVISIRVSPDPVGFRYCIVDEYETEFEQPFETSERPLTLEELVEFINRSGTPETTEYDGSLALVYNEVNAQDSDRASLRHFTTITSAFYPQLYEHFERVFDEWAREPQEEES